MRIIPSLMRASAKPVEAGRRPFGVASLDAVLGGGLVRGCVHEVYAAQSDDLASAAGFAVGVAMGMNDPGAPILWLRIQRATRFGGVVQAHGWAELGGAPGNGLVSVVSDATALLRAGVDALRCTALGTVIVEGWGAMPELDLTASRRLALAAEKSGVPLLLLRHDTTPVPSAAQTRWQVAAAPSHALPSNAPGGPTFDVTLLRQRSGPCGLGWRLEWNRDRRIFREAALSGAVVSPPAHRSAADTGGNDRRAA